jgi:hypothetical protein
MYRHDPAAMLPAPVCAASRVGAGRPQAHGLPDALVITAAGRRAAG